MEILGTKHFIPEGFELGTALSLLLNRSIIARLHKTVIIVPKEIQIQFQRNCSVSVAVSPFQFTSLKVS